MSYREINQNEGRRPFLDRFLEPAVPGKNFGEARRMSSVEEEDWASSIARDRCIDWQQFTGKFGNNTEMLLVRCSHTGLVYIISTYCTSILSALSIPNAAHIPANSAEQNRDKELLTDPLHILIKRRKVALEERRSRFIFHSLSPQCLILELCHHSSPNTTMDFQLFWKLRNDSRVSLVLTRR